MTNAVAAVLARYKARRLDDYPTLPVFPGDEMEETDASPEEGEVERDYELPLDRWRAIPSQPPDALAPRRFVDGSIVARTIGALEDGQGRQRPLLMAAIGAAALELVGSSFVRREQDVRLETCLALISKGVKRSDLDQIRDSLGELGIRLLELEARTMSSDFELARTHTYDGARDEMLKAEQSLVLSALETPTVVDGLLEDRLQGLSDWNVPVVAVVKRLLRIRNHLHQAGINLVYALRSGERTPAIVLQTRPQPYEFEPVVSWFLRLHGESGIAPSWGVVRVAVSKAYFENSLGKDFSAIDRISGWLYDVRCRDRSYQRMPVSLEPIVRVEDHLRALRPSLDAAIGRFAIAAELV